VTQRRCCTYDVLYSYRRRDRTSLGAAPMMCSTPTAALSHPGDPKHLAAQESLRCFFSRLGASPARSQQPWSCTIDVLYSNHRCGVSGTGAAPLMGSTPTTCATATAAELHRVCALLPPLPSRTRAAPISLEARPPPPPRSDHCSHIAGVTPLPFRIRIIQLSPRLGASTGLPPYLSHCSHIVGTTPLPFRNHRRASITRPP
jgi:hypothetical protein